MKTLPAKDFTEIAAAFLFHVAILFVAGWLLLSAGMAFLVALTGATFIFLSPFLLDIADAVETWWNKPKKAAVAAAA